MKFHRKALISYILCLSKSTCPLGANQAFEGLIRVSICCQLCSFSVEYGHLGQVIYVPELIRSHTAAFSLLALECAVKERKEIADK